jgi:hypothetical protein
VDALRSHLIHKNFTLRYLPDFLEVGS